MSITTEGVIGTKYIPPPVGKSIGERNCPAASLPISSFPNFASSSKHFVSFLDSPNVNPDKEIQLSLSNQPKFSFANSYLLPMQNTADVKPKKRPRSKAGPKSRKKGRIDTSSPNTNDEALDTDLFAIVGSLCANKSLDSDSSTSTIINDDVSDQTLNEIKAEIVESESHVNTSEEKCEPLDGQSILRNLEHLTMNTKHLTDTTVNINKSILVPSSAQNSNLNWKKDGICTDFPSKNKFIISSAHSSLPQKKLEDKSLITGIKTGGSPNETSSKCISSLRNTNASPLICATPGASSSQSILRGLMTGAYTDCPLSKNYLNKAKKKTAKNISGSQTPVVNIPHQNSVDTASSHIPSLCQNQSINSQSFYASMGLDEDLCDSDSQKSVRNSKTKSASKEFSSSLYQQKSKTLNIPIKIEKDEIPSINDTNNSKQNRIIFDPRNETLLTNDLHVSMTFEAEPLCEDDEEDDLPLSLLKNQVSVNEITPKIKQTSKDLNKFITQNVDDIHPSLFIKKELIEDEIVSESPAVSSKNLLTVSDANCSIQVQPSFSSTQNEVMNVKIKAEPADDFPCSESVAKNVALNSNVSQVLGKATGLASKVGQESKLESISGLMNSKNINGSCSVSENVNSSTNLSKTKSIFEGLKVPSIASRFGLCPSDSNVNNFEKNICSSSTSLNKKKSRISALNNKKSRVKNTKLAANNVLENSSCYENELDKSLPNEFEQDFKLYSDSSNVSSQHVTDTTDTESNSSKKRGKRKKSAKKSVNIDENIPITLLIKRKKTDSVDDGASDSFLCTSVSKSGASESRYDLEELPTDKTYFSNESKTSGTQNVLGEVLDSPLLSPNLVVAQNSSKKQQKQTKKRGKKASEKVKSLLPSSLDHQTGNKNTSDEKCDTYVFMTFEEQSPVEEITEEDINSILPVKEKDSSIKNSLRPSSNLSSDLLSVEQSIKHEKGSQSSVSELVSVIPGSCNSTESTVTLHDETLSTISSVTSNSNMEDDNSRTAVSNLDNVSTASNQTTLSKKKKKRARRTFGWYKKKKNKSKDKTLSSHVVELKEPAIETSKKFKKLSSHVVELKEPAIETSTKFPHISTNKVPVVIIKNLIPKVKPSDSDGKATEKTSACPEHKLEEFPATKSKNKKKKKGTKSRKKKKVSKNNKTNEVLQNTVPECSAASELSDNHLISKGTQLTKTNFGSKLAVTSDPAPCGSLDNSVSTSKNISGSHQSEIAQVTSDSENNNPHLSAIRETDKSNSLFPSLDVEQIREEINAYEAILQKRGESLSGKSSEFDSCKELVSQSTVSEPNILEVFNSSLKPVASQNASSSESFAGPRIKKEKEVNLEMSNYSSKQVSSVTPNNSTSNYLNCPSNSAQTFISENVNVTAQNVSCLQNSGTDILSVNLSHVKKEKDSSDGTQDVSLNIPKATEKSGSDLTFNNTAVNQQNDSMTDSVIKANSSGPTPDILQNLAQNSQSVDIDIIGLTCKKEFFGDEQAKSANFSIKDQNDLIQKAYGIKTGNLISSTSNLMDNCVKKQLAHSVKSDLSVPQLRNNYVDDDDEIQILPIADQKSSKDVPVVDLTDDNCISDASVKNQEVSADKHIQNHFVSVSTVQNSTSQVSTVQSNVIVSKDVRESTNQMNALQLSTPNSSKIVPVESAELSKAFKTNNSGLKGNFININPEGKLILVNENKLAFINKNVDVSLPSKPEETYKKHDYTAEKDERNIPVMIQICNSAIAGDKYINEYFKHPFPPSIVSHNSKQRNKNKMYMRINSMSWNLSVDEVESRLKLSENLMPQFGKKLGDIVRLEKYPVSISEVECYHRILGVAPSQKLLSKCFKSPDKSTIKSGRVNLFPVFQQVNMDKLENDNQSNQLTLQDVIQGIAETKMMYSNSNFKSNIPVYERDCPSTDTRDSCDSHVSNISTSQNKDFKTSNSVTEIESMCGSLLNDTNSNGGSFTSSRSDFNETTKTTTNLNFTQPPYEAQFVNTLNENVNSNSTNVLSYLNLPSQESINNIMNNPDSSSAVARTCDNINNGFSGVQNNFVSCESYSTPSFCQSQNTSIVSQSNDEFTAQNEKKEVSNIIDVPVTELRKILEAAGSLRPDTASYDQGCAWKSKATFEYNHTQSVPVDDYLERSNSDGPKSDPPEIAGNHESQNIPHDGINSVVIDTHSTVPKEDNLNTNSVHDDSDNDCIDNEPMNNYDSDQDENSTEVEDHTSKAIPQYKSKWEKIMERKSMENKDKMKVNEHMLKDCFPVSSVGKKGKNCNFSNKNISKSSDEQEVLSTEKGSGKEQNKIKKKNFKEKSGKQNDKNSAKANVVKQGKKSTESSKKAEKNRTKNVTKKDKKVSKKNTPKEDDVSNLFVPDKPTKISKEKIPDTSDKSSENNKSKRFYGNRVTNRGTFLTESSSPAERLKNIKIPKKITTEIPKKHVNVRSEEFHSMIKSPVINIETNYRSSYKNSYKSFDNRKDNEFYRSPLENSSSSSSPSSHFIRTKQMRDRTFPSNAYQQNKMQSGRSPLSSHTHPIPPYHSFNENVMGRKPPLLSTPSSVSPLINDDSSMNRKTPLLSSPPSISSHSNDGSVIGRSISPLLSLPSITSHVTDEISLGRPIPTLITQPSTSHQFPSKTLREVNPQNMTLLRDILSAIQSQTSVPEVKNDILPFSEHKSPTFDKSGQISSAYGCNELSDKRTMSVQSMSNESLISVNKSCVNIPLLQEPFDLLKPSTHPLPNVPLKNQCDPPFNSSDILNQPQFTASGHPPCSTLVASQPNRKATCLVPQNFKTLVGHETIDTHNVRLLMLEWSVDWLVQQQQFHDPPPISNALKKVVSTYDSFEDYYNTYFPLMLLETWHRIYVSWTHLNQASPYSCQIISYSVKSHYVSVECQTVFNIAAHPKGVFPDEGSILMVKYSTKSNEYTIKILGYVTHVKTRRFNSVTDSKLFSSLRLHKDANPDVLQILTLTFMGAYNSEDIDKRQPIRIHVLCNVKPTLKQNDALLYINQSPLQRSILNPVADGLLSHTLTPRNSPLEKVNECVREITKGILSPHPLPLLTVVRAKPESDRLNIIPLLIEKMKNAYKTKVLLCVRTVRALGDIAANICLHQSLKMVIINKRCDTNPQFQKYLLDEAAVPEVNKISEEKVGEKIHVKNEVTLKAKKHVLKECDVVLSLIRNCHDEFLSETFVETECVSQMCCIVDEANLCTEPETLIPILHGISKLILIGDPDYPAKVLSKTANSYDYSQSFFQRAYDLDLIT